MARTSEIRHQGTQRVLGAPEKMTSLATTNGPSYAEVTAAGELLAPPISTETEHEVFETQFEIATEWENKIATEWGNKIATEWGNKINQNELRLVAQNSPAPDLLVFVPRWAIRPIGGPGNDYYSVARQHTSRDDMAH